MKIVEVGRVCVGYDDAGEGTTFLDHPSLKGETLILKPGELADLVVALDQVQGDTKAPAGDVPDKIIEALRTAAHALTVLGVRHKLELHLNADDFYRLAHRFEQKVSIRPYEGSTRGELWFDCYGFRISTTRGKWL